MCSYFATGSQILPTLPRKRNRGQPDAPPYIPISEERGFTACLDKVFALLRAGRRPNSIAETLHISVSHVYQALHWLRTDTDPDPDLLRRAIDAAQRLREETPAPDPAHAQRQTSPDVTLAALLSRYDADTQMHAESDTSDTPEALRQQRREMAQVIAALRAELGARSSLANASGGLL